MLSLLKLSTDQAQADSLSKLALELFLLKWYCDQKSFSFFLLILKAYSLNIQLAKF